VGEVRAYGALLAAAGAARDQRFAPGSCSAPTAASTASAGPWTERQAGGGSRPPPGTRVRAKA